MILRVALEMLGELLDARREDRNLHFGRTAVIRTSGVSLYDFSFAESLERHQVFAFFPYFCVGQDNIRADRSGKGRLRDALSYNH